MTMTPDPLHLAAIPGAGLSLLGWELDEPAVRDVVPGLARGNNLVLVLPPAPAHAAPALAGLLSGPGADTGITLALCPSASLGEWSTLASALTDGATPTAIIAHRVSHAAALLQQRAGAATVLLASPACATGLLAASALAAGEVRAVLMAWPELWGEPGDALSDVLQDVPRDAQRVMLTSDPGATAELAQRHCWRAMALGAPPAAPGGPARTLAVAWSRRVAVLPELLTALEARSAAVWTADTSRHDEIRRALAGAGVAVEVTRGQPAAADQVVVFDPPPAHRLEPLFAAGEVTLLVPPGTERWAQAAARPRRPFILPSDPATDGGETARRRATVARALDRGSPDEGLLALGPLFERHEPTLVAAALYQLWLAEPAAPAPGVAPAAPPARIWVNAGRKDDVGPNDLVGLLVNEVQLNRQQIGRIDLRETFSLVEVPAEEAQRIAGALTGRTLRRRRLVARVDADGPPHRRRQG